MGPRDTATTLVLLAVLAGCAGSSDAYRTGTGRRASAELNCPEGLVTVQSTGAGGYIASGCGRRQSYTCTTDRRWGGRREAVCAPDGPAQTVATGDASARDDTRYSSTSLEDARVALAAVARCPSVDREATIAITISPEGTATRTETPGVPVTVGTCVVTSLRSAVFATRRTAEVARVRLDPHASPSSAPTSSASSGIGPAETVTEAAARQAIQALRAGILACSSGQPIAVTGDWSTTGALTLHLAGDLAGTPQDGCIRALASDLVLSPTPMTAGSVLHAVR